MIKNLGARKLGRTGSHRRAMFANMTTSLLLNEQIETTVQKAKELRKHAEQMITFAKDGNHMAVKRVIKNKIAYKKLFDVLAPRFTSRSGGYTMIMRTGCRKGDNAEMSIIKLVD